MKRYIVLEGDNGTAIDRLVDMVQMSAKSYKGVEVVVHDGVHPWVHDKTNWVAAPSFEEWSLYGTDTSSKEPTTPQNGFSAFEGYAIRLFEDIHDELRLLNSNVANIHDELTYHFHPYNDEYEETTPDGDI